MERNYNDNGGGVVRIAKLVRSERRADRFYIDTDDGRSIRADTAVIADYSIYVGRELTEEEFAGLERASRDASAKERAFRVLSSRQMSRRELIDRLVQKGEDAESAERAADLMERIGALNDGEYARAIARHYTARGYGAGRVKEELLRRGIARELWSDALTELPEDNSETAAALVEKKLRGRIPDDADIRKLRDMLLRRGFGYGEIAAALDRYREVY